MTQGRGGNDSLSPVRMKTEIEVRFEIYFGSNVDRSCRWKGRNQG